MVVRLRESNLSRLVVRVLVVLFLVFGATFVPSRVTVSPVGEATEVVRLRGGEAARYLAARERHDSRLRAAMAKIRLKPGFHADGQVVQVTRTSRARSFAITLFEPLLRKMQALAQEVTYYADEAVVVYSPYETDSNGDTAEFSVYAQDYETGGTRTGEVIVWTQEAAYGNPDAAVQVLDVTVECASQPSAVASVLNWFAPDVRAQNSHEGASCSDEQAQRLRGMQDVRNAIKAGIIAAGAAAIPCIGFAHGWIVCVGMAFVSAASAEISWDTAVYVWNCRCKIFGVDCDGGGPPI